MMGWHGSAMTAGSAVGAPVAGFAIDRNGWQWGFLVVVAAGLLVALVGMGAARRRGPQADATARPGGPAPAEGADVADSVPGAPTATLEH
jgi:MFS family permease